jgi:hypothetical protein
MKWSSRQWEEMPLGTTPLQPVRTILDNASSDVTDRHHSHEWCMRHHRQ